MISKILLFIYIALICCEFSEESLRGPEVKKKAEDEETTEDIIASIKDEEGASALKIVSPPDLSKEKEQKKGTLT